MLRFQSRILKFFMLLAAAFLVATASFQIWLPTSSALAQLATKQVDGLHEIDALLIQGGDQLTEGQFQAAVQTHHRALNLAQAKKDDDRIESAERGLADALLLAEDYKAALPTLQRLRQRVNDPALEGKLGLAHFMMGQLPQAESSLRRVINHWETLRSGSVVDDDRITLFEQQSHNYRLLQKVLVAQKKTNEALELAEWSRARALVELLAQQTGQGKVNLKSPPKLADLKQVARNQNATLVAYSIVGREIRVLGNELDDETELFIWVIKPTGEVAFRQVNLRSALPRPGQATIEQLSTIAALVRDSRNSLGVGSRGLVFEENVDAVARAASIIDTSTEKNEQLQQLYQLLIQPIVTLLPKDPKVKIIFIPQGSLFLVPFPALQAADGNYLIQKHTILTSPSIQLLALTRQQQERLVAKRATTSPNALVVGNPVMPSFAPAPDQPPRPLASLPGAEEEAKAIAPLLNTQPLIREQATKTAVLQKFPQSRIIHLATHGLLDIDPSLNEFGLPTNTNVRTARQGRVYVSPGGVIFGPGVLINGVPAEQALARERVVKVQMPGLIALAPSSGNDGFLSAKEILSLKLNAELVVLSACNTGRGRVTGDGIVGLSRAFIATGVPSVIVSLWAVPDAPTAALMTTFYRTLQANPPTDKATALRQAMLTTLEQYPDPRDWAAFTLIGEAN